MKSPRFAYIIEEPWGVRLHFTLNVLRKDAVSLFVGNHREELPWSHYRDLGYKAVKLTLS